MLRKSLLFLIISAIFSIPAIKINAQKSKIYSFDEKAFYKGLDYFKKEKYGVARNFFDRALKNTGSEKSDIKSEAQFYRAMSSVELFNNDAEYLVFEFVKENPSSPHVNEAWFRLADYMYKKKNYPRTITYYEKVDRFLLEKDELSEYYFQKGYSHYMRREYDMARVSFYEIKDIDSKYSSPALYYYSHIAYDQENYQTALEGFLRLLDDKTFSEIAPYYVTQIYYLQKDFEKVLEFAPAIIETVTEKRKNEVSKIIGESYFYLGRYQEAISYLQSYADNVRNTSKRDKYQLAYSYYMTGEYKKASKLFEKISLTNTEISQSALYHLGDCYLKLGDKDKARAAFGSASRMEYNQDITEDALFNYAKLTYELSYSPFNEAIRTFNYYINQYPTSPRVDEAYNFLVNAYLNTRNYKMAMESIEKIKSKDPEIERAYQRVAFFRGLELFTNQRFSDALIAYDKSLKYSDYDPLIHARTLYWLAETYVRENDMETAETYYRAFLDKPSSIQTPEYKKVNYSMGYLEFERGNYDRAEKWFREYVNLEPEKNSIYVADAYNRLGDCRFISSKYWQAIEYYDKVIAIKKANVDYAIFQRGFSLGLVDRPQGKIETMQELIGKYPNSAYIDDALFELGKTYVILDDQQAARRNYSRLVEDYPGSTYLKKTLIQLGLIFKNAGNTDEALNYYKRVVNDYPGTPEASIALRSIRDIYVSKNNVDGYLSYVENIGEGVSVSEQDSLVYSAAENLYLDGNCEIAVESLKDYLQRFPRGAFMLNANYYLADCLLKLNRGEEAFNSLMFIIEMPTGTFTEPALRAASRIAFRNKDYHTAAELYRKLIELGEKKSNIAEAEIGLMRSYVKLEEYQHTIDAANQVLIQDKLEPAIRKEAVYAIANASFKQNDPAAAYDWYSRIDDEVNSEFGAEAKYRMAEIDYNRGNIERAEEIVYEMIELNTPHQYWMGKTFLLLSDIFLEKDDEFQAVQTLESLINYYTVEGDGIIAEAIRRKEEISARINRQNEQTEADTLEIQMEREEIQ
ncbi:MAG: tetratricopeptide repeat protein [Bacteroidota bacterium]